MQEDKTRRGVLKLGNLTNKDGHVIKGKVLRFKLLSADRYRVTE